MPSLDCMARGASKLKAAAQAMRMASAFEEDLLQDLSGDERGALGEMLIRLLRRVEHAQPDAGGRLTDLD